MQISIWPGGLPSNAQGTIDWAGGLIDWNGPDIQANGYYYAQFESVDVKCFNANSAPGTNKGVSYTYNNAAGTNDTVVDGNMPTVLKSLLGTGTNMSADFPNSSGGSSASASAVAVIPGLSGAGPGTDAHPGPGSSGGSGTSGNVDEGASQTVAGAATSSETGFDQGLPVAASGGSAARLGGGVGWSVLGALVAGVAVAGVGLM